jgi:hypothetical protein
MAVSSSILRSFPSMSKMPPQRVLAIQQCFNLVCSYHGRKGNKKMGRKICAEKEQAAGNNKQRYIAVIFPANFISWQ